MYKLLKMMPDDDGVFFNPFMIGPAECSQRNEYKQPAYVTYPPPYATLPKAHTNKSVSKGSFFVKQEKEGNINTSKSQLGEICFSKAIKKDMVAAKQLANGLNDDHERIYAGRASKTSKTQFEADSVRTLMPVRSKRSASEVSTTASEISAVKSTTDGKTSKLSLRSQANKNTDSNVTLKAAQKKSLHKDVDTDLYENVSHVTVRSSKREADNTSHHSMRSSRRGDHSVDNISRVSAKSKASVVSRPKVHADTKLSRVSLKSKTTERQTENVSRISFAGDENRTDNITFMSKSHSVSKSRPSIQEVAESIQKELAKSMETTRSLSIKAAELNERLKAGNEFKHNRFNTLARQCVQSEPLKRCREDRMALWYKDSVLS
ncbi:uncharacterized protein LOC117565168 [Drosophila albomicans]|uniref:Uncharacterized protein LOC117565168 n=1 Tax=Drosophila albomicans TaxID=7291 RepID=A0A6P8WPQ3_DROAB|nr:uncharacterized protein LOC117565168 [Drosophila albomicans]